MKNAAAIMVVVLLVVIILLSSCKQSPMAQTSTTPETVLPTFECWEQVTMAGSLLPNFLAFNLLAFNRDGAVLEPFEEEGKEISCVGKK